MCIELFSIIQKYFLLLMEPFVLFGLMDFFDHFPLDEGMSKTNIYNTTSSFYIVVYMLYNEITLYTIETAINVVSNADDL